MATILPQILGDNVNIPSKSSGCPLGLRPSGHPSLLSGILTLFPLDFREYFAILLGDVEILLQSVEIKVLQICNQSWGIDTSKVTFALYFPPYMQRKGEKYRIY